jgi:hypothetical protein
VIEALDDFIEKPDDDEALGNFCGNAASGKVEEFVFVDLAARWAVSAPPVSARISSPGIELASASSLNRRFRTF